MYTATCPHPRTLEDLLLGRLSPEKTDEVSDHFLACDHCVAAAEKLTLHDPLTDEIREDSDHATAAADKAVGLAMRLISDFQTLQQAEDRTQRMPHPVPSQPSDPLRELPFLTSDDDADGLGKIGDYKVIDVIGAGGMGVVLRAADPGLGREVAIKVIKPSTFSENAKARFMQEAQVTAKITHQNVITVHQVGEHQTVPFVVMPLLVGETLKQKLDRVGSLPEVEAIRIARQIADGVRAAHENGLLHRDIKPENVFIEEASSCVKILDFGLARSSSLDAGLTQSGMIVGTPKYMSPEQASGDEADHRSDLFSLGSVLYHMLSGQAPFEGKSVTATLNAVSQAKFMPLADVASSASPEVVRLTTRLLSLSPNDRPASAAETSELLAEIAASTGNVSGSQEASKTWGSIAAGALFALIAAALIWITIRTNDREVTLRISRDSESGEIDPSSSVAIRVDTRNDEAPKTKVAESEGSSDRKPLENEGSSSAKTRPPLAIAPFNAIAARKHQQAWAAYLRVPVQFTNAIGMRFQLIPPGEFMMGTKASEGEPGYNSERPHRVRLTEPFYIAETPVTQAQWHAVTSDSPWSKQENVLHLPSIPATYVSWRDSTNFANQLSVRCGMNFRLPYEAEWEWACRAGSATARVYGDGEDKLDDYAWYDLDSRNDDPSDDHPFPVALKLPNAWNLFDVHGNVWEWCQDWYDSNYYFVSPLENPRGPESGEQRVQRGASWTTSATGQRSGNRAADGNPDDNDGVRLVLEVASVRESSLGANAPQSRIDTSEWAIFDGSWHIEIPTFDCDPYDRLTIEGWFTIHNADRSTLVHLRGARSIQLYAKDNVLKLRRLSGDKGSGVITLGAIQPGRPMHIAAVYDSGNMRIYVDGKQQTTRSHALHGTGVGKLPTSIGAYASNPPSRRLIGRVGSVRVSSSIRYHDDFDPNNPPPPADETLFHFDLTQTKTQTAKDLSGNNHHGIFKGK